MRLVRIACVNVNTTVGAVRTNVDRAIKLAKEAAADGATIVAFPEQLIPGYSPEDLSQWHSFVDATATLAFMLDRTRAVVEGLVVYEAKMQANLDRAAELFFSEAVLLALVEKGMARQEAYVWVQRNAMRAWNGDGSFRANLAADREVMTKLSDDELAKLFDLGHALRHAETIVERALLGGTSAPISVIEARRAPRTRPPGGTS
jgi:hypothetical protein